MDTQEKVKTEIDCCNEMFLEKNKYNQFIYVSTNGKSTINLPYILDDYKEKLINKGLVCEIANNSSVREIRDVIREETKDMSDWTINAIYQTLIDRIEEKYLLVNRLNTVN